MKSDFTFNGYIECMIELWTINKHSRLIFRPFAFILCAFILTLMFLFVNGIELIKYIVLKPKEEKDDTKTGTPD